MLVYNPKILVDTRLLIILSLGFSSGLPLALTNSTLQAWFTQADIDLMMIGALTLIGIPYTLKFLWAPLMDHYRIPVLGRRKGWIVGMQLGLALTLFLLANMQPQQQAYEMGCLALLIAFFSASQDISITAYQTELLDAPQRGLGAASYVFGYRVATLISGGFALIFADYFGWKATYEVMGLLMLIAALLSLRAPAVTETNVKQRHLLTTIKLAALNLLQREKMLVILLFIVFYKLGDALALSLITNFLLHGLGFSLTEVGLSYKIVSFLATILGVFVGGMILTRWDIYRALLLFGCAQAVSNLAFVFLAMIGKHFIVMSSAIFIENFCSGMSTAALLAFMMSLCDHRFTASQFALLSAVASLARVFLGPFASMLVVTVGWVQFFFWAFLLSFPGIFLLMLLKNKVTTYANAEATIS